KWMPLGAVPTGRQSTSGESGDQVRLLLISLASLSFSNAFAAQQPNGFNQPNHRAHSNLKNHDRSENHGVDPNENHHCQSKVCRGISVTFFAFIREELFALSEHVNTGGDYQQLKHAEEPFKAADTPGGNLEIANALPHIRIRFPQPRVSLQPLLRRLRIDKLEASPGELPGGTFQVMRKLLR